MKTAEFLGKVSEDEFKDMLNELVLAAGNLNDKAKEAEELIHLVEKSLIHVGVMAEVNLGGYLLGYDRVDDRWCLTYRDQAEKRKIALISASRIARIMAVEHLPKVVAAVHKRVLNHLELIKNRGKKWYGTDSFNMLWDAINNYVRVCGGDPSRQNATIAMVQACDRVNEASIKIFSKKLHEQDGEES